MTANANAFERALTDADAESTAVASDATGLAVLVAEDNEINALLSEALLCRLGHRPTLVGDGDAAVTTWRDANEAGAPFDLVLMDLHMPGRDGLSATKAIRAYEEEHVGQHVTIVALTANASDDDRESCLAAGFDGFLTKPVDRERLSALLEQLPGLKPLAA